MRHVILCLTLCVVSSSLAAQTHRVDAIDPEEWGEMSGGRGRNELILYTPDFSWPSTQTNPYGSEAVVIDGLVISVGGNDTVIPDNGYVISGNGDARSWIVGNLTPGTAVAHDDATVWVDSTFEAQRASLLWRLGDLERRLEAVEAGEERERAAESIREEVSGLADPLSPLARRVASMEEMALNLELAAMPSPPHEVRSVWYRLLAASPEEIASDAQAMAEAHINAVFAEVNFGSSVAYPDPTGLYPQLAHQVGSDPLTTLIDECHARGIEVHAWVHNFFLGFDRDGTDTPSRFAAAHPEWISVNRRGEDELVPWGLRYLNPAHLGYQDAMIEAHTAMVAAYDLDGYHCDHIRYCLSMSWESGWDYSDHTRERVRSELGFDPLEITPDGDPERWAQWLDWRQAQITSYLRRQVESIREVDPDILISAAVFPELESAIADKGQNWGAWVEEGLIDIPMPMIYTPSNDEVTMATRELISHVPEDYPVVMGLGPFLGFSPRLLTEQIGVSRAAGATGQCLFVWHMLSEENIEALVRGPWRSTAPPLWSQ
jgi:uncharacterized lipoprotein YddW (UPF0748 family)